MKKLLLFSCLLLLMGCGQPEPEFYVKGKPYYTRERCVDSKIDHKWEYHYGYNYMTGKFGWHYGYNRSSKCIKSVIDTIEIK